MTLNHGEVKEEKSTRGPFSANSWNYPGSMSKPSSAWQQSPRSDANVGPRIPGHRHKPLGGPEVQQTSLCCRPPLSTDRIYVAVCSGLSQLHFLSISLVRREKTLEIRSMELEKVQCQMWHKLNPWTAIPVGFATIKKWTSYSGCLLYLSAHLRGNSNLTLMNMVVVAAKTTFLHSEKCFYFSGNLVTFINPPTLLS